MSDIESPFDRWLAKLIAAAPTRAWEPRKGGFASGSICVHRRTVVRPHVGWRYVIDCNGSRLPVSSTPARALYDAARDAWASAQLAIEGPAAIEEPTDGNSTTHRLKSWPKFFRRTRAGLKTWERRRMDRDYNVGDILVLEEYDPDSHEYTGRRERVEVTSVTQGGMWGLAADWCLMGVTPAWSQLGDIDGLEGPVYCRSHLDGTVSPGEIHEGQLYSVDVAGNDSGPEPPDHDYEFCRRWVPGGAQ
jgi:hypothetical protein